MKKFWFSLLLLTTGTLVAQPLEENKAPSPPEIYQNFLVALVTGDKVALQQLCVPRNDLSVLTEISVPEKDRAEAIAQIKASPYRVLKRGEIFQMPDGSTFVPTREMEKKGWVVIVSENDPAPHMLRKAGSGWKVDAGDLITARKAAAKVKR